jgi:hypothetical protein
MHDDLLAAHLERMPSIVPALETDHNISPTCEQIHYLAFAFVTPLGSHYDQSSQAFIPFRFSRGFSPSRNNGINRFSQRNHS